MKCDAKAEARIPLMDVLIPVTVAVVAKNGDFESEESVRPSKVEFTSIF